MTVLQEISFTKYLPFTMEGSVRAGSALTATLPIVDTDPTTGEEQSLIFRITLGARSPFSFALTKVPGYAVAPDCDETNAVVWSRSLSFSNSAVRMGSQLPADEWPSSMSIPLFSTLIKFVKYVISLESKMLPLAQHTGIVKFSAVSGGRGGNARARVYEIVGKSMERDGMGRFLKTGGSHGDTFLLNEFIDLMVTHNILETA